MANSYCPTLQVPDSARTVIDPGVGETSPANDDAPVWRLGTIGDIAYRHWIRQEEARAYFGRRAVEQRREWLSDETRAA